MPEGVNESGVKEIAELSTLLICKSRIHSVCLRILQIDLFVCYVKVAAYYDALFGSKSTKICSEIILPLHSIIQTFQAILCIGNIYSHKIEILHLEGNHTTLVVMLIYAYSV